MILTARLKVSPGIILFRITTTRGSEFSQSSCKTTSQGGLGLTLVLVRFPSFFLVFAADIHKRS
jgi:hypothetical protein